MSCSGIRASRASAVKRTLVGKSMSLPVYVINLDTRQERWATLAHSAERYAPNFDLRRVSAIDGNAPGWRGADLNTFAHRCGRRMLPGEYGCYFSHLKALETFVADGAPFALILEDDVVFDEKSVSRISAILEAMPDFETVRIVNHRSSLLIELGQTSRGDRVGRTLHGPQGSAAAYLVSRHGAKKLLASLKTMSLPWDVALERFWDHGASTFSTKTNLLQFSEHVSNSSIASGGYARGRFPWYRRLRAALFRTTDYTRRVYHVLKRPSQRFAGAGNGFATALPLWTEILAALAVLVLVSAVWVETDAYRFAALALTVPALIHYFRFDVWSYHARPYIGPMGILCLVWGAYVALRFAYSYLLYPEQGAGSSEGIYLFTLLYPALGAAFLLYVKRPFIIATVFMLLSLAALTLGIDYWPGSDERALALLQNNPIHASVGAGFIALCAVPYLVHVLKRPHLNGVMRFALIMLAGCTFLITLLAIYSLWSKGVWLALAIALPFLTFLIITTDSGRWGRPIALAAVLVVIVGTATNFGMLRTVAGPTVETSVTLVQDVLRGDGFRASLDRLIADPSTPESEHIRMMLWANALDIWSQRPIFGAGISWMHEWQYRRYQETDFNLLHNGYLELAVRYGVVGLAFYLSLFVWTVIKAHRAAQAGLIDMVAFQTYAALLIFFAITLLTNSNIRLAIGESFMWVGAGFGFYCHYLLQRQMPPLPDRWDAAHNRLP